MPTSPDMPMPSVLAPASSEAAVLHELSQVLLAGAGLVFLGVALLLALALRRRVPGSAAGWIVGGGIALPVVALSALLLYSTARTAGLERPLADPQLVVSVTGHAWWWEVRYPAPAGAEAVVLANELRLPLQRPAQISLQAEGVIHSLWVPQLGGKRDLVPGRVNHLVFTPWQAGVYRAACAEYCGTQHARMALPVVAMPAADFERWLAAQARPAPPAAQATPGAQAFRANGCAACHSVRGHHAPAGRGPDLTHVASRLTLGAGVLPNEPGSFKRWLVGVQQLKPGARMPSYAHLDAATLDALVAYLETLQ
ncbi:MAG: c-type cytochrome [Pseudomonadota bacterium]